MELRNELKLPELGKQVGYEALQVVLVYAIGAVIPGCGPVLLVAKLEKIHGVIEKVHQGVATAKAVSVLQRPFRPRADEQYVAWLSRWYAQYNPAYQDKLSPWDASDRWVHNGNSPFNKFNHTDSELLKETKPHCGGHRNPKPKPKPKPRPKPKPPSQCTPQQALDEQGSPPAVEVLVGAGIGVFDDQADHGGSNTVTITPPSGGPVVNVSVNSHTLVGPSGIPQNSVYDLFFAVPGSEVTWHANHAPRVLVWVLPADTVGLLVPGV